MFGSTARPTSTPCGSTPTCCLATTTTPSRASARARCRATRSTALQSEALGQPRRSVDINENRDNVYTVNNIEHGRTYSAGRRSRPTRTSGSISATAYMDIYTQTEICFADTGSTVFTAPCPVPAASVRWERLLYTSRDHYAYGDAMWKPHKRVTAMLGYCGSMVRGTHHF